MSDHTSAEALRDKVTVQKAYLTLLTLSHGNSRARLQANLASLRDEIARLSGKSSDEIQDEFEAAALSHSQAQGVDNGSPWEETARLYARNADYYRGLIVQIGEMLGADAKTQDDGNVQEDILCAKVPEIVAKRLAAIPSTQGVTITDEMLREILADEIDRHLDIKDAITARTIRSGQNVYVASEAALAAMRRVAPLPKDSAQGEGIVPALLARDEVIDRLRNALKAIEGGSFNGASNYVLSGDWQGAYGQLQIIARRALLGQNTTPTDRDDAPLNPDEAEEHIAENRI